MTTLEQRMAALDAANQVRIDRALLRSRIKAGEVRASRVLEDWPVCIHGCGVYAFLTFLPQIGTGRNDRGTSRAFGLLRKADVPGHKRVDQLTAAQFERLAREVRAYEDGRHPAERGMA